MGSSEIVEEGNRFEVDSRSRCGYGESLEPEWDLSGLGQCLEPGTSYAQELAVRR